MCWHMVVWTSAVVRSQTLTQTAKQTSERLISAAELLPHAASLQLSFSSSQEDKTHLSSRDKKQIHVEGIMTAGWGVKLNSWDCSSTSTHWFTSSNISRGHLAASSWDRSTLRVRGGQASPNSTSHSAKNAVSHISKCTSLCTDRYRVIYFS